MIINQYKRLFNNMKSLDIQNKKLIYISYLLMFISLIGLFYYNLIPMVISGIIFFAITKSLYNSLSKKTSTKFSKTITLLVVILIIASIFAILSVSIYYAIQLGKLSRLEMEVIKILEELRTYLPSWLLSYIPRNLLELKNHLLNIAKESGSEIFLATSVSAKVLLNIIIGMILGAVISFSFIQVDIDTLNWSEFSRQLFNRISIFFKVVTEVLFAQVKISLFNTILTAIYFFIILRLFDIDMPYAKSLILLSFLFGLIPVLGNLIINFLVVALSITVSFKLAIFSLLFLVLIHKLEYYINAKIVGSRLHISIWELLISMVVMEAIFGMVGVVLAPAIYGYIKEELKLNKIIN